MKDIVDAFKEGADNQEAQTQTPPPQMETPELDALKAEVESLKQSVAQLTDQLRSALEKQDLLAKQNTELARVIHQEMVEHYCDLAMSLNLFESREEAEQKAKEFDAASLRKEIVKLSAQVGQRRTEAVACPGGEGRTVEKPVEGDESKGEKKEYTIKDLEETLSRLLGNKGK